MNEAHYEDEPHDNPPPARHHPVPYLAIFAALLVLTVMTVAIGIGYRAHNEAVNVLLAVLIASIKGALVAMFFMHLKFEGKLIYLIVLAPLGLCVLLVVALLPDFLPIGNGSMHMMNPPPMMHPQSHHP